MNNKISSNSEIFGLIKPFNDAHSLGISSVAQLLEKCGYKVYIGNQYLSEAVSNISKINNISYLINWIKANNITHLGFSYRLDPKDAQKQFGKLYHLLQEHGQLHKNNGQIIKVYFAGLPESCDLIQSEYSGEVPVFYGDESQKETLLKIGVPVHKLPPELIVNSKYDDERMSFARDLIRKAEYNYFKPVYSASYSKQGSKNDNIVERLKHKRKITDLPLTRVHVGPYQSNYTEAKKKFISWVSQLANTGFLDILSIGTSQLSQSNFGEDWNDKPNGGGVPINSEKDFSDVWNASRPMLLRTYSATKNIPQMVQVYEKTINMAWHALSLWWFNKIDGRGPYDVKENLRNHFNAITEIAKYGKPFEPNIPHHFAFRGADDITYVLSGYLGMVLAKRMGIKTLILQIMLNTPKYTLGIQDLAKSRALVKLAKELEDKNFKVLIQPRAGLDYFSPDIEKAKIQLAAVSAMMDDIEPLSGNSPDIIHVVSYSEAVKLADPEIINESIQISLKSIEEYRKLKRLGNIDNMILNSDVEQRCSDIFLIIKNILKILESSVKNLYSPEGFYEIFHKGVLPVPYLWEGREEFHKAVNVKTDIVDGGVKIVNENGQIVDPAERIRNLGLM